MSTELLYSALRFGSLILIWVLIGSALFVLRRDIASHTDSVVGRRGRRTQGRAASRSASRKAKKAEGGSVRSARYLAFTGGPLHNKRVPLTVSPIIIGRAPDCTVTINDSYASGHHLRLYKNENQWFVEDLNSTNGTLLNGARLQSATPLSIGMKVQIGQTTMELTR